MTRSSLGRVDALPLATSENGTIESFNGKIRKQFLHGELFYTLKEPGEAPRQHDTPAQQPRGPATTD